MILNNVVIKILLALTCRKATFTETCPFFRRPTGVLTSVPCSVPAVASCNSGGGGGGCWLKSMDFTGQKSVSATKPYLSCYPGGVQIVLWTNLKIYFEPSIIAGNWTRVAAGLAGLPPAEPSFITYGKPYLSTLPRPRPGFSSLGKNKSPPPNYSETADCSFRLSILA